MQEIATLAADPAAWGPPLGPTLIVMEVVLGIDNLIFISILSTSCRPSSAGKRGAWASRSR